MSQSTLDIMNGHRKDQIELSPSSELFQIVGGGSFYGIFDNSNIAENNDSGNIEQKNRIARIMVSTIPAGLSPGVEIKRESGESFNYSPSPPALDDEGVGMIWLY